MQNKDIDNIFDSLNSIFETGFFDQKSKDEFILYFHIKFEEFKNNHSYNSIPIPKHIKDKAALAFNAQFNLENFKHDIHQYVFRYFPTYSTLYVELEITYPGEVYPDVEEQLEFTWEELNNPNFEIVQKNKILERKVKEEQEKLEKQSLKERKIQEKEYQQYLQLKEKFER